MAVCSLAHLHPNTSTTLSQQTPNHYIEGIQLTLPPDYGKYGNYGNYPAPTTTTTTTKAPAPTGYGSKFSHPLSPWL